MARTGERQVVWLKNSQTDCFNREGEGNDGYE